MNLSKKHNISRNIILSFAGLLLCLFAVDYYWLVITKVVNKSYLTHPYNSNSSLDVRLNHANTYYWYARYRKNSQPEFLRSKVIVEEILREIPDSMRVTPNRKAELEVIKNQAKALLKFCNEQSEVSQLNIAAAVPMYLEIMGYDENFMEQDCDDEEVETRSANRAIDVILDLVSPEKNAKIGERPLFALVNVNGESKVIHESIIQKLNSESKFYTISDHELVKILGANATYNNVFSDSLALLKVAKFFGAKRLALIELTNNDKIDGIHYYGMRYNVWQYGLNAVSDGVYTEYFLKNRNFNQMTILKFPLLFLFLAILGTLGFAISMICQIFRIALVPWYHSWISHLGAVITIIGLIDYGFMEFLNPLPSDYYSTDEGELWQMLLPLGMVLIPIFINYIILGRLDKHFPAFQSRLNESKGLFSLLSGGFAAISLIWINYRIMRFGMEKEIFYVLLYTVGLFQIYAFGVSRWVEKIINFPQRIDYRRKILAYVVVFGLMVLVLNTTTSLIIESFLMVDLMFCFLALCIPFLLEFLYKWIPDRDVEIFSLQEIEPVNLKSISFSKGKWMRKGNQSSILKIVSNRSLDVVSYIPFSRLGQEYDWFLIDFGNRGDGKTHYYPYAKAFEHLFTNKLFNEVTEQSRFIGNLLGKIISTISSVGEYLIDDSDPKPRRVEEVAKMISDSLADKKFGLIFQHPESGIAEDLELFEALLTQIYMHAEIPPVVFCEGSAYSLQQKFNSTLNQFSVQIGDEPISFQLAFKNVAQSVLETQNIEAISRVLIEERLSSTELDQSPTLANQAVKQLLESPIVGLNDNKEKQLRSSQFDLSTENEIHERLSSLDKEELHILNIAAICSNDTGIFNVELVTAIAGIDRRSVMDLLNKLQLQHLIIDLQDDDSLDLFQFAEIEIVKSIRQEDELDKSNINQTTRDYYRSYVAYFLPSNEWSTNREKLVESTKKGLISERELTFLAIRANRIGEVGFLEELVDFVLQETIANGITASFTGAHQLIKSYRLKWSNPNLSIDWNEFHLCVETGAYDRASVLFNSSIRAEAENNRLTIKQLLICVRYCFGHFMYSDNAILGRKINERILVDKDASSIEILRAKFYTLKLISNKDRNCSTVNNMLNVQTSLKLYEELIESLNYPQSENVPLLKEVLNDYIGFFADSVWPLDFRNNLSDLGIDLAASQSRFNQLIKLRLLIERIDYPSSDWLDSSWVKRGTPIDYRGLCFTYNYIQRGLYNTGSYNESIQAGIMSFTLNSFIGDPSGKQICAGYLSKAYSEIGMDGTSLYWAEQSVAYCEIHSLYAGVALANLGQICNKINDFSKFKGLSGMISRRHIVKHFNDDIPNSVKKSLLLNGAYLKELQNEIGSRFYWGKPVDFELLHSLVEMLQSTLPLKEGTLLTLEGMEINIIQVNSSHGKHEITLKFPKNIGTTNVVELSGNEKVKLVKRGNSSVQAVTGIAPRETYECGLVVQEFGVGIPWHLKTAHPGSIAPPFPSQVYSEIERSKSEEFWNSHAFIIDERTFNESL